MSKFHSTLVALMLSTFMTAFSGAGSEGDVFRGVVMEITDLGSCSGCSRSIERALERITGVVAATLDSRDSTVTITSATGVLLEEAVLRRAVRDVGYSAGTAEFWIVGELELRAGSQWLILEGGREIEVLGWPRSIGEPVPAGSVVHVRGSITPSSEGAEVGVTVLEGTVLEDTVLEPSGLD